MSRYRANQRKRDAIAKYMNDYDDESERCGSQIGWYEIDEDGVDRSIAQKDERHAYEDARKIDRLAMRHERDQCWWGSE